MSERYVIGLDGGGTKTIGVLYGDSEKELYRTYEGFANFSVDENLSLFNVKAAIHKVHEQIRSKGFELTICIGVAGITKYTKINELITELESKYNAKVIVVTDILIALYAIKKNRSENIIMAIGGTGSAVMAYNGVLRRFGGTGHLLGDEGSAYHLVIEALKKIIYDEEHDSLTSFDKQLMMILGCKDSGDIIKFVYNRTKSEISSKAREISKFALDGHKEAISLLKNEGKLLAEIVTNAYSRTSRGQKAVIALRGGFILNAPYAKEQFFLEVKEKISNFEFEDSNYEPVVGTYYLAKERREGNWYGSRY